MDRMNIGIIGLGVMGENLILNLEENGFKVAVFNRTYSKVETFLAEKAKEKNVIGCSSLEILCNVLETPRKILLIVKAGKATDDIIQELTSKLDPNDIIIDAGNAFFRDTLRREKLLAQYSLRFLGIGISGGGEGARKGPSIMVGGSKSAWEKVKPILTSIAAKVANQPCCQYMGSDGAGHYVKMVHNGIEYAVMQLIAETYALLESMNLNVIEIGEIFAKWNKGDYASYLFDITEQIMRTQDSITGKPLLDVILDVASQKGTGKWTVQEALELGVPIPNISTAVFSRYASGFKLEREKAAKIFSGPKSVMRELKADFLEIIAKSLRASIVCSYAQGFTLLEIASTRYGWQLNLAEIARIWRGGCIIRIQFLEKLVSLFKEQPKIPNLLFAPTFQKVITESQIEWRRTCQLAISNGIPIPGMLAALAYYDTLRTPRLPVNLIQAQRDYFGAHSFERIDFPPGEFF